MFLTPAQVSALVQATPWPYNVLVHVAAWAGLRAAELGGLTIANVELPNAPLNQNAPAKPGVLRVEHAREEDDCQDRQEQSPLGTLERAPERGRGGRGGRGRRGGHGWSGRGGRRPLRSP